MLYIVATPIGNLKEITYRAVEVLKSVDMIYAEDTRHSAVLLKEYGIEKPLFSYQKFSEKAKCAQITDKLSQGKNIALISDAGMPLISDPGFTLVCELKRLNLEYTVVSGACACINAVVLSGMDTSSFYMAGFLPPKNSKRERFLESIASLESTLVFYSPPHDVKDDLLSLYKAFGARKVSVVREISKKFETVHSGVLGESFDLTEKGEMVIVTEGAPAFWQVNKDITVKERLCQLIDGGMDKKEAVKAVAKEKGVSKSEIYKESIDM